MTYTDYLFRIRASERFSFTVVQAAFRGEVHCSMPPLSVIRGTAFLHPEPPGLGAATTYQLQAFQLLLPQDDIWPWDPVHLQSMRVSGYCIFSIDVPNDMAITDAGYESKVLNHPAR